MTDARIQPNKEVPTGAVTVKFRRGTETVLCDRCKRGGRAFEGKNICLCIQMCEKILFWQAWVPLHCLPGLVLFLFVMMTRQMAGEIRTPKMLNFGRSRAQMSKLNDYMKVYISDVAVSGGKRRS